MTRRTRSSERNIPWMESIPARWAVVRSKGLFSVRKELALPADEQLSATQAYGVIAQKEFERRVGRRVVHVMQHLEKRRHVERDDFVISMRSFQGGLERAWATGCIRSSYIVLKPSAAVDVGYFAHLFKSANYIHALQATSNFIRDGQDLNVGNFALVDLPLPPMDEQRAIGRFLDYADRRIRKYIAAKRKLIALLEEQKRAIIQQAVTRGLDPNVRLKDSGMPWIGMVPEHWEVKRLAQLFEERVERGRRGLQVLTVSLRTGITIGADIDANGRPRKLISDVTGYKFTAQGDVVYNTMRMWQGAVGVSPCDGLVSPAYVVARPRAAIDSEFFGELFRTPSFRQEANQASRGIVSDRNRLYWDEFRQIACAVPPLAEQQQIAATIRAEVRAIELALASVAREVHLLREYRARVISDGVTGTFDVREAAAHLPNEPEHEPEDTFSALDDALDDDDTEKEDES
jgi:type I restriction enzyme S subunit